MDQQCLRNWQQFLAHRSWPNGRRNLSRELQQHEFAEALDANDVPARQFTFNRAWIINKVRFAERNRENAASCDGVLQSARNGFDFRKFRHGLRKTNTERARNPELTAAPRRATALRIVNV